MKTRVLFIIDSLGCGGAEKSLVSLLTLLDYSRLDVYLSIVSRGGVFEQYIPESVNLVLFPRPSRFLETVSNGLFSLLFHLLPVLGIKRHGAELGWVCRHRFFPAFEGDYDVAVAYHQGFPTYYVSEKVRACRKVAWINIDMEKAGYRSGFNRPFYDRMSKVCVVSEALSGMLPDAGFVNRDSLCVVHDIINPELIRQMSTATDANEAIVAPLTLLTVGRIVPQKNYLLAVETARVLAEKGVDFRWIFVGDGPDRTKVENRIKKYQLENIVFLAGMLPNPYPYFAMCDIYVQTSSFEGFGITLSEAKIFHKPIVTTCFPSAYDQIMDEENGLIAEMNAESLAEKILSIIKNPSLRDHLIEGTQNEENRTVETESAKVNSLLLTI